MVEKANTTAPEKGAQKADNRGRTPAVTINPDAVISLNSEYTGKVRRPGTKVAAIFEKYKNGMTVKNWLTAVKDIGGSLGNLRKDLKLGRITLKNPS